MFLLCELDNDIEKQTAILNMKEEIQKCFACSEISSFKKKLGLSGMSSFSGSGFIREKLSVKSP